MIKTRINNEYKDVIKIFGGGTLQKEIIKVWSREAQEYVYESSVEYTGSLPITINANGDALIDYRIYGASGGVGEQTDSGEPAGYKLPMTVSDGNTTQTLPVYIGENQLGEDEYVSFSDQKIYKRTENLLNSKIIGVAQKVKIEPNTEYVLSRYASIGVNRIDWSVYNESDERIYGGMYMQRDNAMQVPSMNSASYIMITIPEIVYDSVSIVKGTFINTRTAVPATYIPYVEPTEPTVPLPEIPTIDGETVIDYDGTPKPSQMYVKYRR